MNGYRSRYATIMPMDAKGSSGQKCQETQEHMPVPRIGGHVSAEPAVTCPPLGLGHSHCFFNLLDPHGLLGPHDSIAVVAHDRPEADFLASGRIGPPLTARVITEARVGVIDDPRVLLE